MALVDELRQKTQAAREVLVNADISDIERKLPTESAKYANIGHDCVDLGTISSKLHGIAVVGGDCVDSRSLKNNSSWQRIADFITGHGLTPSIRVDSPNGADGWDLMVYASWKF